MDQSLRPPKWLPSRTNRALQDEPHLAAAQFARPVRHFDASTVYFMSSRPKAIERSARGRALLLNRHMGMASEQVLILNHRMSRDII